jgi:hypothetical protein
VVASIPSFPLATICSQYSVQALLRTVVANFGHLLCFHLSMIGCGPLDHGSLLPEAFQSLSPRPTVSRFCSPVRAPLGRGRVVSNGHGLVLLSSKPSEGLETLANKACDYSGWLASPFRSCPTKVPLISILKTFFFHIYGSFLTFATL